MLKMRKTKLLLKIAFLPVALMIAVGLEFWYDSKAAVQVSSTAPVIVTVAPTMTTKQIGELLYEQGFIHSTTIFRLVAKVQGVENKLQAGDYALTFKTGMLEILQKMTRGETVYQQLTIPEGYTINQIAQALNEQGLGDGAAFKRAARSYANEFMSNQQGIVYFAEGYVFPDTYRITKGMSEEVILKTMVANFDKKMPPNLRDRAKELGLSVHQVITLASLVEKEARLAQERPIIAGVFFNRLKQDMPLQSCPTVQYILGYPKAELSIADTQIASPYNTYQDVGLPPGPIASPGIDSIMAVLYPADTPYVYFVAAPDGSHRFSKTYEEHLQRVDEVAK